jgi:hypothetical protein
VSNSNPKPTSPDARKHGKRRVFKGARVLTAKELQEWRERMELIGAGRRRHYWGTL